MACIDRAALGEQIVITRNGVAVAELRAIEIIVEPSPMRSIGRRLEIGRDDRLSVYDASYVELADRLGATLFTAHDRLAKAARTPHLDRRRDVKTDAGGPPRPKPLEAQTRPTNV